MEGFLKEGKRKNTLLYEDGYNNKCYIFTPSNISESEMKYRICKRIYKYRTNYKRTNSRSYN